MAIDVKQLQTIIDNLVTQEMRDFANTPDADKNRLRQLRQKDVLDSFSSNQFLSKLNLIDHIKSLNFLNKDSEIVIMGSWYGSILIPAFYNEVKKITCIDVDSDVIYRAKYELFKGFDIDFITGDVFEKYRDQYTTCDLFANTSPEHMAPMKEWGSWSKYKNLGGVEYLPLTLLSHPNAMFDIPHIQIVYTLSQESQDRYPENAEVLIEDEVPDPRGTRFTLIGLL